MLMKEQKERNMRLSNPTGVNTAAIRKLNDNLKEIVLIHGAPVDSDDPEGPCHPALTLSFRVHRWDDDEAEVKRGEIDYKSKKSQAVSIRLCDPVTGKMVSLLDLASAPQYGNRRDNDTNKWETRNGFVPPSQNPLSFVDVFARIKADGSKGQAAQVLQSICDEASWQSEPPAERPVEEQTETHAPTVGTGIDDAEF